MPARSNSLLKNKKRVPPADVKSIAILVYHREGKSLLKYLLRHPHLFPKAVITVCDSDSGIRLPRGVLRQTGSGYLENLERFDFIFRSPGLSYFRPEFLKARRAGAEFTSLTRLFFREALKIIPHDHIIGVTGSKGKSTTATLIYKFLEADRRDVYFVGNIGKPALDVLPKLKNNSWVVLELSSFQLEELGVSPHVAVLCELFPEHLDVHGRKSKYYAAKSEIVKNQLKKDSVFYLARNKDTVRIAKLSPGRQIPVGDYSDSFSSSDLRLRGEHQYRNAVLAASVAGSLGVSMVTIKKILRRFGGLPHRMQFVRRFKNIDYIDDSASTNPTATIAAIRSFYAVPHVLIAGGVDKNLDYGPLAEQLRRAGTRAVLLIGKDKDKIAKAVQSSGAEIIKFADLESAVRKSAEILSKEKNSAVIFSPAAMSLDMFRNYADRGDRFKQSVRRL